ncbi:MAG: hypothetical protein J0L65_13140 [Xanthomonadales bacterium]|nr:hypothetical protein [Xanthomonadales bacterium]
MPTAPVAVRFHSLPFVRPPAIPGLRRKAVLLTLVIQVLIGAFVLSQIGRPGSSSASQESIQVEWIRAAPPPALDLPPPRKVFPTVLSSVRPPVTYAPDSSTAAMVEVEVPASPPANAPPTARRLQDQLPGWLNTPAQPPSRSAEAWRGKPLPRLPGREEAFVEGIHTRDSPSPQQRVQAIAGMFLGARPYDCDDVARKMRSNISDAERRQLIEDERRMCGRGR